jgi:hypothetical protein
MLQVLLFSWLSLFHPFFVSVTEINHNAKNQTIEVSCRMFYDDLEKALNTRYHTHVDIVKPADKAKLNQLISDYIKRHLIIKADGKAVGLTYIGYEIQEDGAWCYFEAKGIATVKRVDVHDELLYNEHPEQINMLHVTVNGERKSTKVNNPDADAIISF